MLKSGLSIVWAFLRLLVPIFIFLATVFVIFCALCFVWYCIFRFRDKMVMPKTTRIKTKRPGMLKQILLDVPRRYMLDQFQREPDFFTEQGIHLFCGEQGAGKTIACVEMMLRLRNEFPDSRMITNFDVVNEDDSLTDWHQLLDYTNGHRGVIVGMDEMQNWFMSGKVQLPPEMLEVATQNRKNRRIICGTAQVFTRVNKALREQVTFVYRPVTFLRCFTVVQKCKPQFDSEGNVTGLKHRGLYAFTHTDELRAAYDTYKVIHTLSKDGFKERPADIVNHVTVATTGKK